MISKDYRFHGLSSLRYVYKKGKSNRGKYFVIKYIINNRRTKYRASVVVSKKVSKSAVVRNRIRRRLYEQIRLNSISIKQPYDIVIIAYSDELASLPHEKLSQQINKQLKLAEII